MRIKLDYGDEKKELEIPDKNLADFFTLELTGQKASTQLFDQALGDSNPKLEDIVSDKNVCVILDDSTRIQPREEILHPLCKRLTKAHFIQFIIATGTHKPEYNIAICEFIKDIVKTHPLNFNISINNSTKEDEFEYVGTTQRKTEVFVNKKALPADIFVVVSGLKPHYFAGYSNPIKNFLPGICSFETIRQNHCALIVEDNSTYGMHPWHPLPQKRQNPITEDMLEGMKLIVKGRYVFALNFVGNKEIIWAKAGEVKEVTQEGIKVVDKYMSFNAHTTKYLVLSPGKGEDKTFYVAQRALELTKQLVSKDTEVLWIANLSGGIHHDKELLPILKKDYDYIHRKIKEREAKLSLYKAFRFKNYLQRVNKVYCYCDYNHKDLLEIGVIPVDDPQKIIEDWLKKEPTAKILALNKANKLALYRKLGNGNGV
ncbi:MAG: lactate racemase domain-containing protein [bacterium]